MGTKITAGAAKAVETGVYQSALPNDGIAVPLCGRLYLWSAL